jgi:hypothetical protein
VNATRPERTSLRRDRGQSGSWPAALPARFVTEWLRPRLRSIAGGGRPPLPRNGCDPAPVQRRSGPGGVDRPCFAAILSASPHFGAPSAGRAAHAGGAHARRDRGGPCDDPLAGATGGPKRFAQAAPAPECQERHRFRPRSPRLRCRAAPRRARTTLSGCRPRPDPRPVTGARVQSSPAPPPVDSYPDPVQRVEQLAGRAPVKPWSSQLFPKNFTPGGEPAFVCGHCLK